MLSPDGPTATRCNPLSSKSEVQVPKPPNTIPLSPRRLANALALMERYASSEVAQSGDCAMFVVIRWVLIFGAPAAIETGTPP